MIIEGIFIEGLIYGIMVWAVFISFRVLRFADLTIEGSFPLGAAVMAVLLTRGFNPLIGILLAFLAGLAAGFVTALIHNRLKIPDILSGILTMTMLWSVNLRIMSNRANVSLLGIPSLFSDLSQWQVVLICILIVLVIKVALDLFFRTDFGLSLGALGSNPQLVVSQGMNPDTLKMCGICLSNGLIAVSGALASMYQGFADVNFGSGMIVAGLASLMIGEFIIRSNKISVLTLRAILGSILYRALMYAARIYGFYLYLTANDLRFLTGALIIVCIIVAKSGFRSKVKSKPAPKPSQKGGSS